MRGRVLVVVCVLAATPSAAQEVRAPAASENAPVTVLTRVRHVSTVVLPETAEIVDLVAGDPQQWDVSAAAHLVFVRPLVEGARSNLVLLTAAGDVVPLTVIESADGRVDAVVRVETPRAATADSGRVLAAIENVAATAARAAEARAAERVEAARTVARARLDADRESYPRQFRFDYRWEHSPAGYPWMVEGMWHDGLRTYLRTRALVPVLHERRDGELVRVEVSAVLDDVVHVVPRVLGSGALEVGGQRLQWTARPRKVGP